MFKYFYKIWDKFRYKYKDKSEIVAAAIYTYKGERGKDKKYVELEKKLLTYNFKTIDVEKVSLENISEDNHKVHDNNKCNCKKDKNNSFYVK